MSCSFSKEVVVAAVEVAEVVVAAKVDGVLLDVDKVSSACEKGCCGEVRGCTAGFNSIVESNLLRYMVFSTQLALSIC